MRGYSLMIASAAFCGLASLTTTPAEAGQTCRDWFKAGIDRTAEPQDSQMALFEPDCYAWRLFVSLNWPSKQAGCGPDMTRKLGDAGDAVWERWIPKQKVYLKDAKTPPAWSEHCGSQPGAKQLTATAQIQALLGLGAGAPGFQPPVGTISNAADEEVRLNESALGVITVGRLFSLTQQRKIAAAGVSKVDFPLMGKEVKAHWIKLDSAVDRQRYHTGVGQDGTVYGLVALHITTKDLPNWFWATFEHVDNKTRWPGQHPNEFAGWTTAPIDRFACAATNINCEDYPKGIGLENTKWQFYRLKATQVDWVDSFGRPTIVVNSKIEAGFNQRASSCISCHSLARVGDKSGPMPFLIVNLDAPPDAAGRPATYVGVVTDKDLRPIPGSGAAESSRFLQLDFVWSLRNACPEPGDPLTAGIGRHC